MEDAFLNHYDGDVREVPMSTLAYIGDAVYELYVRMHVLGSGHAKSGSLHQRSIAYVKASFQAAAAKAIEINLSEEEQDIIKRGRNSAPGTMAKNASPKVYRLASGFECLIGYLYLTGNRKRLVEIIRMVLSDGE